MPRNGSGVYSLPTGNPVVSGATIDSSWANTTMDDVANELTNSLDRQGRGGMLAAFKHADGLVSAPGITWTNEPTTGFYRAASGDMRLSIQNSDTLRFYNDGGTRRLMFYAGAAWNNVVYEGGPGTIPDGTLDNDIALWDTGTSLYISGDLNDLLPTAVANEFMAKGASAWEAIDTIQLLSNGAIWAGAPLQTAGLQLLGSSNIGVILASDVGDTPGTATKAIQVKGTTALLESITGSLSLTSATNVLVTGGGSTSIMTISATGLPAFPEVPNLATTINAPNLYMNASGQIKISTNTH